MVSDFLFWGPKRLGMKIKKMFSLDLHVYHNFHRALGLSTSPYLKKLSQKMQEGVIKNSENPIKVAGCRALIYISICRDCSSHQMTQAIQKQLGFLPSLTAAIAEKKEEALRELKAR